MNAKIRQQLAEYAYERAGDTTAKANQAKGARAAFLHREAKRWEKVATQPRRTGRRA